VEPKQFESKFSCQPKKKFASATTSKQRKETKDLLAKTAV
jgi:hypothetical protein